ncbi:MAG: hypothetical protein D6760_09395, partial [Deltaproteobacteria bacterium]
TSGLAASLRGMGAGRQPWLGDRLRQLAVPVHLVTGERDAKYTQIAQQMAATIVSASNGSRLAVGTRGDDRAGPAVRHTIVEGAGHNVHASHPERFAGIVGEMLSLVESAAVDARFGRGAP